MRDIKSRLDHNAPPVGKLYTQTAASRRSTDQLHRKQLAGLSCYPATAFPMPIIVQRVKCHSARFAKGLTRQPALFKIPYQALGLFPAPTPSPNNLSRINHTSTSTRNHNSEKGGFARRDTEG